MIGRRSLLATLGAMVGVLTGRLEARAGMLVPASPLVAHRRRDELLKGVALREREVGIPATAFGAMGNSSADDTAAINAALAAAGQTVNGAFGGRVILPKGTYLISSPLIIPNGVTLAGQATANSTQIVAKSSFNSLAMVVSADIGFTGQTVNYVAYPGQPGGSPGTPQEYANIENVALSVQLGAVMLYGIYFSNIFVNSYIRDCIVLGIPGISVYLEGFIGSAGPVEMRNCWLNGPTAVGGQTDSGCNLKIATTAANTGGAFTSIGMYHNSCENSAAAVANIKITNNGNAGSYPMAVTINDMQTEATSAYHLYVDGCPNLLVDNFAPFVAATTAGILITSNFLNIRQIYREVSNVNAFNPILHDLQNGVTFGNVWVPYYATPDGIRYTGQMNPALNSTYSLGQSGLGWSAVWGPSLLTSDIRLKREIVELDYGLEELLRLMPVSFDWKDGKGGRQLGFVAQAVQDIIPEAVVKGDDPEGLLGLKYASLIPVIIKAIAELNASKVSRSELAP